MTVIILMFRQISCHHQGTIMSSSYKAYKNVGGKIDSNRGSGGKFFYRNF